jgi:hypothetical protein
MAGRTEWNDSKDQLSITDRPQKSENPTRNLGGIFCAWHGEVFPALAISKHPCLLLSQPNFKQEIQA